MGYTDSIPSCVGKDEKELSINFVKVVRFSFETHSRPSEGCSPYTAKAPPPPLLASLPPLRPPLLRPTPSKLPDQSSSESRRLPLGRQGDSIPNLPLPALSQLGRHAGIKRQPGHPAEQRVDVHAAAGRHGPELGAQRLRHCNGRFPGVLQRRAGGGVLFRTD